MVVDRILAMSLVRFATGPGPIVATGQVRLLLDRVLWRKRERPAIQDKDDAIH